MRLFGRFSYLRYIPHYFKVQPIPTLLLLLQATFLDSALQAFSTFSFLPIFHFPAALLPLHSFFHLRPSNHHSTHLHIPIPILTSLNIILTPSYPLQHPPFVCSPSTYTSLSGISISTHAESGHIFTPAPLPLSVHTLTLLNHLGQKASLAQYRSLLGHPFSIS